MELVTGHVRDPERRGRADRLLFNTLSEIGVDFERVGEGAYLVQLPSGVRDATSVWVVAGDHGLVVESLFLRRPDSRREEVLAALLARNLRTWGVHFAVDEIGDVFLVGTLPYAAVWADLHGELDRVLGQVLAHVEQAWLQCVAVGFADALAAERASVEKLRTDGAGRRPSGSPVSTPAVDPRR